MSSGYPSFLRKVKTMRKEAWNMNLREEEEFSEDTDNIYDADELSALLHDDELQPREEAFMRGYLETTEV